MKVLYFNEKDLPQPKAVDFKNKDELIKLVSFNFLNKLQSMFEWKGLPTTIPQRALEQTIQRCGVTNVFTHGKHIYQSYGNVGGELNYNYMPRISVIANPYIKDFGSKTLKIYYGKDDAESMSANLKTDGDCCIIPNDSLFLGVLPMVNFYASQYVENVISKRIVTINSRAINIFIAPDEKTKQDFMEFIKALVDGDIKAIMAKNYMAQVNTLPFAQQNSNGVLSDLIEDQQYIKASWLNEFGLNANYNMKRESLNSNESQLNEDMLLTGL